MKFLIDAQLPRRLSEWLTAKGHDSRHTSQLPLANTTPDGEIARIADSESRVVVTKDRDFRDSHLLAGTPARLLVVSTGNITNSTLVKLFEQHVDDIIEAFTDSDFVELRQDRLTARRKN